VKIDDSMKKAGLSIGTAQTKPGKGADKAAGVEAKSAEGVQISSELKEIAGKLSGEPVFDTAKVDEIKAAISDGRFRVDAEKVAAGLIDSVRDLIHTHKK